MFSEGFPGNTWNRRKRRKRRGGLGISFPNLCFLRFLLFEFLVGLRAELALRSLRWIIRFGSGSAHESGRLALIPDGDFPTLIRVTCNRVYASLFLEQRWGIKKVKRENQPSPAPSSNEFTMISRPVLRQLPTHRCQGGTLHPSRGPFSADNALTGISRDRTNIHRRNLSAAADAQSSRHGVFVPLCLTNPQKQAAAHPQSRGCLLGQSTLALSIRSGNYRNNPQTRPR